MLILSYSFYGKKIIFCMFSLYIENDGILLINPTVGTHRTIKRYRLNTSEPYDQILSTTICSGCTKNLVEPYIKCAECPSIFFCLNCFAKGCEVYKHRNNHSYIICDDTMPVFACASNKWSAKEEKKFLNQILSHGYGNWDDIAKSMDGAKTPTECIDHYHKFYFDDIFKKVIGLTKNPYFRINIPYLYKVKSIEPPRPTLDSITYKMMAGYQSARSEFDTPYDNSAESIVSNLVRNNDWMQVNQNVGDTLNCAMFTVYNNRLQ